jgi:hypothetical protein
MLQRLDDLFWGWRQPLEVDTELPSRDTMSLMG